MPDIRERFRSLDRLPAPDLWAEVADRAQAPQRTSWPFALGAAAVVVLLAVLIGLQLRSLGEPVGADPSASAEPSASVEPSASAEPTAEPSFPGEPAFTCEVPINLVAAGSDFHPLVTQDIQLGTHDGYDRIVFEYDGGTPFLELDVAEPPFVQNPSGLPIEVAGSQVYRITLTGATKFDTETVEQPYQGSTNFEPGFPQIMQFVEFGDFEATHNWYLGVNGPTCLRAFTMMDPHRLVIDVQHAPPPTALSADGDFQLTISSPKTVWRSDEAIAVEAMFEYLGSRSELTLYGSGTGLFGFRVDDLTGGRSGLLGPGGTTDCRPHAVAVGTPMSLPFTKSGGYGYDHPDAAFWESYFADPELHLPAGLWRVTVVANFSAGGTCGESPHHLEASIVLTIE